MWKVDKSNLSMAEGDYGISLPITINGTTIDSADSVKFIVKTAKNGTEKLVKTFTNIVNNTFDLVLTAEESALLTVGYYVYSLDWYKDGTFECNIIPSASLQVVDKA